MKRTTPLIVLTTLSATAVLTACGLVPSEPDPGAGCAPPDGLAVVVPAHANVPAPAVDDQLACMLDATIAAEKPVVVVAVDGTPSTLVNEVYPLNHANETVRNDSVRRATSELAEIIASARPDSDGADTVEAIAVAVDALRSAGASKPHIVLDDTLPDRGAIDLTVRGALEADPDEMAAFAARTRRLNLDGVNVLVRKAGYSTAPQTPLGGYRDAVTTLWKAFLTDAGATVEVDPRPVNGPSVETSHVVDTVEVPKARSFKPVVNREIVLDNTVVAFEPDTATLSDPTAAGEALAGIASWLTRDPSRTVVVTGTTAGAGTEDGRLRLSDARARSVARALIQSGVRKSQLSTRGVGTHFAGYQPDVDESGRLDPIRAASNRTTRITLHP